MGKPFSSLGCVFGRGSPWVSGFDENVMKLTWTDGRNISYSLGVSIQQTQRK